MSRPPFDPTQWHPETIAVRGGSVRSQFGEHSEAMYLTSSFVFESAAQAAARFSGQEEGNVYARFTNPSVTMFEERLAQLEGAQACLATASGMAAITTTCMGLLSQGDHIVSSKSIFGATVQLFATVLTRFGITTTFVEGTDIEQWAAAVQPNTKMFYVETPSNPLTEIIDLKAMKAITEKHGITLVVDNCFCTPALQKPFEWGADVVIHSATKYLDGQGRVLGGAIVGSKTLLKEKILPILRTAGPSLSAFNAWVLLKGLETLQIRMDKQSANALFIAKWLEENPNVRKVFYPGLPSHPQYELACAQQTSGGAIVSFEVVGDTPETGRANAWKVIDQTQMLSITANLGDTRTTITHPATTTHGRLTPEARNAAGISENLIRIAVGLEKETDVCTDLAQGFKLF
ncbi:MAG: O-succinylhomoserine sulfhydrylase [Burkholderiales bacterium]|nr:O-succinylhomoserine sulfhydrylase [Burkholderiales bacterium]